MSKRTRRNTNSSTNISIQTVNSALNEEIAKLQKQVELLQLENDTLKKHISTSAKADTNLRILFSDKAQEVSKINNKVCGCKSDCSSKRCGCVKENNKCTALCKCNSKVCQNQEMKDQNEESDYEDKENIILNGTSTPKKQEVLTKNEIAIKTKSNDLASDKILNYPEEQFDPMKPRHQLSRTPPRKNKSVDEEIHVDNTQQESACKTPLPKSPQIVAAFSSTKENSSDDLNIDNIVDWLQHTAQLIPCKKCGRTFMPHRIQKHESCCKKI